MRDTQIFKAGEKWFSIRQAKKVNGKPYMPSVCYQITEDLERVVAALVASGDAVTYVDRVRFVSGVAQSCVSVPSPVVAYNTPLVAPSTAESATTIEEVAEEVPVVTKTSSGKRKSNKEFT